MSLPSNSCIPSLPGRHKATHFIMAHNPSSYALMVEKVDADLFELAVYTVDEAGDRTEYILHCSAKALTLLSQGIATTLYDHHKTKEVIRKK